VTLAGPNAREALAVPPGTGSLDVLASFELAPGASGFGVSARSDDVRVEVVSVRTAVGSAGGYLVVVNFYAGPQPCVSVRGQHQSLHLARKPTSLPALLPCTRSRGHTVSLESLTV